MAIASVVVSERRKVDVPPSPAALLYLVADTEQELTRMPVTFTRMSDEDEIRIGDQLAGVYVNRQQSGKTPEVGIVERYITRVGEQVGRNAHRKLPYKFHYIPGSYFINAFALPGGHVFVGGGLLELMDSEDELAAVIGHEIEHIDHYHCAERVQRELALRQLSALGDLIALPIEVFEAGYSKDQELEADREGTRLAVQAGYDERVPLSMTASSASFPDQLQRDFKGTRIAWAGDFNGHLPYEPGVLDLCRHALTAFESLGCVVEEAVPDFPIDAVWQAWLKLRAWQNGGALLPYYSDPSKRALLKPEAVFEVESGLKLKAFDITAASAVRTEWYQAVRRFFGRYDYFIVPTAQVFAFAADLHWPTEIAGHKMQTYHEWMKGVLPVTMAGCPALAAPAGFRAQGLPMGIQIVARNHDDLACLQLAHAYDLATRWVSKRPPPLITKQ